MVDLTEKGMPRNLNNAYSHGTHFLIRLTYMSRANEGMSPGDLNAILATARTNNKKNGITGSLVFNKNFFLQSIEGSRPVINDLLNKLVADDRHFDLQIIESIETNERIWGEWSMNYVAPSSSNASEFLKFSTGVDFNPYLMTADAVEKLLKNLSEGSASSEPQKQSSKPGFLERFKRS